MIFKCFKSIVDLRELKNLIVIVCVNELLGMIVVNF